MKVSRNGQQRGFTLTEILVAVAIFATVMVAALLMYDRSNRQFKQGIESADMQQTTRVAFDKLVADLRMTGFDYDRDAAPSVGQQQPDEQIEFAGLSAMTMRGNFDYFTDAEHDHGRENYVDAATGQVNYEPSGKQFPVVTTGNDEIVTFALKSTSNPAANSGTIQFYADVSVPRSAYSGTGGAAETLVSIGGAAPDGYDLCATGCNNPPYTLYRITLKTDGTPNTPIPIAENIRSLRFHYYGDLIGTTEIAYPPATGCTTGCVDTPAPQGAIGGLGQYDPTNVAGTANYRHRERRADIRSIKVELTGMNPAKDLSYTNPTETLMAFKKYRTYTLQSLIVPRNLGLSGSEESALGAPGPPTIDSVCSGHCGAVVATWSAGLLGSPVEEYQVCYDTSPTGNFSDCTAEIDASITSSAIPNLSPGTTYYFKVKAKNAEGTNMSANYITKTVKNSTKPVTPTDLTATTTGVDGVTLSWSRPTTNDPAEDDLSCQGTGGSTNGSALPDYEPLFYKIWRGETATFNPNDATTGYSELALDDTNRSTISGTTTLTWIDREANKRAAIDAHGPAACKDYFYRIQTFDTCNLTATHNVNDDATLGAAATLYPAVGSNAIPGESTSTRIPAAPTAISVDFTSIDTVCDPGHPTPNICSIVLNWNPVTTDTTSPTPVPMAIDNYIVERYRSTGIQTFAQAVYDTEFTVSDTLEKGTTFKDETAQHHDPTNPTVEYVWWYKVMAVNCGVEGALTAAPARYPSCSVPAPTISTTDSLGSGTGLTAASPWVFWEGDAVSVTAATGVTAKSVRFDLRAPDNTLLQSVVDTTSPFVYGWTERTNDVTYSLTITFTDTDDCINTQVRYITDQAPGGCVVSTNAPTFSATTTSGNSKTQFVTYVVSNIDTFQPLTLRGIDFTWAVPPSHVGQNLSLENISYNGTSNDTLGGGLTTPGNVSRLPSQATPAPPDIGAGSTTYTLRFTFEFDKGTGNPGSTPALSTSPFSKICLSYTVPSEPATNIKRCNIVPATSSPNPSACQ